jgi:thiol-disulfide isomerase/thioredoxin
MYNPQLAPDIVMTDMNGNTAKLSDLRGQVVLLDFWASWCVPCRQENPNVVRMYNEYKDKTPDHYYYDFNWTMNDVGVFGLKTIEEVISFRKHKARLYERYLDQDKIKYFKFYGGENIFLDFPIIIKTKTNKYVYETLFLHGYDIKRIWYSNNARISADYNSNDFLDTEFLEQHILCLPTHNNINEKDIINICKLINKTL